MQLSGVKTAKISINKHILLKLPVHFKGFRAILEGFRGVPAPPKGAKMAKYPSKMAGWRVSS